MSNATQFALLREKRFANFFFSAISGTVADNVFKNFLVLMVTYHAAQWTTMATGVLANLAAGIFILPYVLFSATAGQLADRYDKARVMQFIKGAELCIMGLATAAFYAHSLNMLLGVLFLLGSHSAFYGPVKYSILPRVLQNHELTGGNGLVEMGTFLGILGGALIAGVLTTYDTSVSVVSSLLLALAAIGFGFSLGIPKTGSAAPDLKIDYSLFRSSIAVLRDGRESKSVWNAMLGISWFWFFGALILSQLPGLAKHHLGGSESTVTLLLAVFSIGIAAGSLLCERLSGEAVEIGLVPLGSIGLSVFGADLYFSTCSYVPGGVPFRPLLDLFGVGVFGGFYIVPLYALVQSRSKPEKQSRVVAANNILNAAFMVASAAMGAVLLKRGVSVPGIILAGACLNVLVAAYLYTRVPEFRVRFVAWWVGHLHYPWRARNAKNSPDGSVGQSTGPRLGGR